jgi:lipoate-protein ligase A
MSSEVETSRGATPRIATGFFDFARNDTTADGARSLFEDLDIYDDTSPRSVAMNMAIDEALLECAAVPSIRFYRWQSPALSFGYFGKFSDVAIFAGERDLVRRWTGGGIVLHGEDLTYSIVIPSTDPAFGQPSLAIYEKIHRALAHALNAMGEDAVVAGGVDPGDSKRGARQTASAVADRRSLDPAVDASSYNCFANPVRADVMIDGRKIAGAAQRRTRRGLLQQGSIQGVNLDNRFADRFANALSSNCGRFEITEEIFQRAQELALGKYGNTAWLRKR